MHPSTHATTTGAAGRAAGRASVRAARAPVAPLYRLGNAGCEGKRGTKKRAGQGRAARSAVAETGQAARSAWHRQGPHRACVLAARVPAAPSSLPQKLETHAHAPPPQTGRACRIAGLPVPPRRAGGRSGRPGSACAARGWPGTRPGRRTPLLRATTNHRCGGLLGAPASAGRSGCDAVRGRGGGAQEAGFSSANFTHLCVCAV
jgi:hypothetical protein